MTRLKLSVNERGLEADLEPDQDRAFLIGSKVQASRIGRTRHVPLQPRDQGRIRVGLGV